MDVHFLIHPFDCPGFAINKPAKNSNLERETDISVSSVEREREKVDSLLPDDNDEEQNK